MSDSEGAGLGAGYLYGYVDEVVAPLLHFLGKA